MKIVKLVSALFLTFKKDSLKYTQMECEELERKLQIISQETCQNYEHEKQDLMN
jgi:hypothetical protein